MDLGLADKVAIVTGAGQGIGRAIALTLGREKAKVAVTDIDVAAAREVAAEVLSSGSPALAIEADVTNAGQVTEMVARVLREFGEAHILVNNAGLLYTEGAPVIRHLFAESATREWQGEIDIVLYGTLNCTKAVIGHMIERQRGKIINVASVTATTAMPRRAVYGAAKAGVIAFTRTLAAEVGGYGITVNAVAPGEVRTTRAIRREAQAQVDPEARQEMRALVEKQLAATALGRLGEPQDVANTVVFLASEAADWITGQTLGVDGGFPMLDV